MKSIVIVIVAAACLLGVGFYFAQAHFGQSQGVLGRGPGVGTGTTNEGTARGAVVKPEDARLHPESDGSQFSASGAKPSANEGSSSVHGNPISFEGAELPAGDALARKRNGDGLSKKNSKEWQESEVSQTADSEEPNEVYVSHEPIQPHKSAKALASHNNDDLLIMEGRSEDRLASAKAPGKKAGTKTGASPDSAK